jgi:hypothetical protein
MKSIQNVMGIEINPKFVGAFFTEKIGSTLRVFCFYLNGDTSQFDVPADENVDSLQNLFSKLKLDENCSSVIIDEVVQGRVYVRLNGNCWLYTLLSAPGNNLPPLNSDICHLPWRYCWRSKAADILEYGQPGGVAHCFAVRTQISENDVTRLVGHSKAFANPVSFNRHRPQRQLLRNIGIAVGCLGIPIAILVFSTVKLSKREITVPPLKITATAEKQAPGYYLLYDHEITGPYPVKVVTDMGAGRLLNPETMCRAENSTEWVRLSALFPAPAKNQT